MGAGGSEVVVPPVSTGTVLLVNGGSEVATVGDSTALAELTVTSGLLMAQVVVMKVTVLPVGAGAP
jgi:hypothetical protein